MSIFSLPGSDARAIVAAVSQSQAIIEFSLDGTILTANENFCKTLGYSLNEIVGKHHSMFCQADYVRTSAYKDFWARLGAGEFVDGTFKRLGKQGNDVWIQASYNPVLSGGRPYKVVKFASDITEAKLKAAEDAGKIDAISRIQAVIEFKPTGEILTANENFLGCVGYRLDEIVGRHHSMFCDRAFTESAEYRDFWAKLAGGTPVAAEFKRIGKNGSAIWIQASYNPIFDADGCVFKVVKFATDITERVRAVDDVALSLHALSGGDLTARIERPFTPGLEQIRLDLNTALDTLADAMRTISRNAEGIASASSQIHSAADHLAERTERQAAAVEETASALEEITTAVADSASRAEDAGSFVSRTKTNAERSSTVMRNAVDAMGEISKSSREISNIIGVIDEIAFQTNLLALNAGVEAARAGEAGKGFAVVAQEVRELAQRSATAAKEIKTLIKTSSDQVGRGVTLVGETGQALEDILSGVADINSNVSAIVEASREQSLGLKEINKAVNEMDENTQRNASMVQETTVSSESLAREAQTLHELLGRFRFAQDSSSKLQAVRPVSTTTSPPPQKPPARGVRMSRGSAAVAVKAESNWEEF